MKRVVIVANGELYDGIVKEISEDDIVIGVDKAAYWLLKHGITPQTAIGDFDSTTRDEREYIQSRVLDTRIYSEEKDYTDSELAFLEACKLNPDEIVIAGGSGSRIDHMLATISLLERGRERHIATWFINETNAVTVIDRGRTIIQKRGAFRYVSFLPLTATTTLTLQGFKYPLIKKTVRRGQTICVSNEFLKSYGSVTVLAGKVLVIQSND